MSSNLIQYIVIRKDLIKTLKWPVGAVIAQACHAVSALLYIHNQDEYTIEYGKDIDNMTKCILEVENEAELKKIADKLTEHNVSHKLWIEQPENIATCLAIKVYPKNDISKYVKGLKLFK